MLSFDYVAKRALALTLFLLVDSINAAPAPGMFTSFSSNMPLST
jgi:hypothetical protein